MKKSLLLICLVSIFVIAYSQDQDDTGIIKTKNSIGIYSNIGICELSRHQDQTGIVAAHGNVAFSYGLSYNRTISRRLKLETGIFYTKYSIVDHIIEFSNLNFYAKEYFQIISIPIIIKYYFPKDYFISGGTILDLGFERNNWVISDPQNGFALSIGAGKEISFGKFFLSIGTNFDLHAAIPFSGDLSQQKFFVPGLKIGLNYNIN
jgi:hypothetical protein